jgi:hypothetical protein
VVAKASSYSKKNIRSPNHLIDKIKPFSNYLRLAVMDQIIKKGKYKDYVNILMKPTILPLEIRRRFEINSY